MLWTNDQVSKATRILGKHSRVCDALPEIEKAVNRKVTASSLKHAMKQRGADAPSYYLQRDLVVQSVNNGPFPENYAKDMLANCFSGEAARKAENAWVRNVDSNFINQIDLENVIRPVDGLAGTTFVHKSFPYTISDCEYKPEKITKIMVCPDTHHPFVNKTAWKVFLKACKVVQPDILVIVGDFADVLALSAHQKKPSDNTKFKSELKLVNDALDQISALMIKRVVFIAGNHCHRIDRYIAAKAPELDGMMNTYELLKLKERGFEYVPYGEYIRIGEMTFTHDVGRCGVSAARQSLQDFGDNLTFGHSHRAQVVYGGTVEGKTHVCMNVGWLGDYDAIDYRNRHTAKRDWTHSFGFIYQDSKGVSYCNLVPIINGSCIVDGKLVRV